MPTAAWHPLPHQGYNGNQQTRADGAKAQGSPPPQLFLPPRTFWRVPPLLSQRKKFRICLADMNGLSVIPGILLGGGSMPVLAHRLAWPGTHSFDSYTRQAVCVLETVLCTCQATVTSEARSEKPCNAGTAALRDPDHCARTQHSWPFPASSTRTDSRGIILDPPTSLLTNWILTGPHVEQETHQASPSQRPDPENHEIK